MMMIIAIAGLVPGGGSDLEQASRKRCFCCCHDVDARPLVWLTSLHGIQRPRELQRPGSGCDGVRTVGHCLRSGALCRRYFPFNTLLRFHLCRLNPEHRPHHGLAADSNRHPRRSVAHAAASLAGERSSAATCAGGGQRGGNAPLPAAASPTSSPRCRASASDGDDSPASAPSLVGSSTLERRIRACRPPSGRSGRGGRMLSGGAMTACAIEAPALLLCGWMSECRLCAW